uniref:Large ribosomal subunit protein uL2 n=1 Tax=candidate division WOR-3 bacterium TaxID=2052148 RepID=A0A7C3J652_UNCW3
MGLKIYKPITPGFRFKKNLSYEEITKKEPEKSLTVHLKKTGGRNNLGRVTNKFIGGGSKKKYRIIDFKRDKFDIPGKVISIEYDPNRTSFIALVVYPDGEKRYIIAPEGLKVGDEIISGLNVPAKLGNSLPLKNIPVGLDIHNIELNRGKGGQIVRSAGSAAQILAKEGDWCHVKLPSGEVRLIRGDNFATVGKVGNSEWSSVVIGKAGTSRHRGIRPRVRAVAKNPVDHPMGGGEGRTSGGRHPCSENGLPAKGYKTRKKKKYSDKYIIARRKK